jgi:hypothetical protein
MKPDQQLIKILLWLGKQIFVYLLKFEVEKIYARDDNSKIF